MLKYKIQMIFFRSLYLQINLFSDSAIESFTRKIGRLAFWLKIRKDVVLDNISHAFPELSENRILDIAVQCYMHIFTVFIEFVRLPQWDEKKFEDRTVIKTPDAFQEMLGNPNGKLFLTGHFGSWEVLASNYSRQMPMGAIVKKQSSPAANDFFVSLREELKENVFYMKESVRRSFPWLKEGKSVFVAGDQDARHHGVFVNFLGRPASTYTGVAVFSKRTKSDIYFTVSIRRDDGKYDIHIEKMFDHKDGYSDTFVHDILQLYMDKLEFWVRKHPEQYFWLHKRWKTQPGTDG